MAAHRRNWIKTLCAAQRHRQIGYRRRSRWLGDVYGARLSLLRRSAGEAFHAKKTPIAALWALHQALFHDCSGLISDASLVPIGYFVVAGRADEMPLSGFFFHRVENTRGQDPFKKSLNEAHESPFSKSHYNLATTSVNLTMPSVISNLKYTNNT